MPVVRRRPAALAVLGLLAATLGFAESVSAQTELCFGVAVTIQAVEGVATLGTDGDDVIMGTPGVDDIRGGPGDDTICGGGGADLIFGNGGDDRLDGDGGRDLVSGGPGRDLIIGGTGGDMLRGNKGRDLIRGKRGDDRISGGNGDDTIFGGSGTDTIFGGGQDDTIFGNGKNDTLTGGRGDDIIEGGNGDDLLEGKSGNDTLRGDRGDDQLVGGAGDDVLFGKQGEDELFGGRGWDRCRGGKDDDTLVSCEAPYLAPLPEAAAPFGLGDVAMPGDADGITALFNDLPMELLGGQRTIDLRDPHRPEVSYGFTEPVGCGSVGLRALDVRATFGFPAEFWVAVFADQAGDGDWDVEEFGRDGDLSWVTWRSTCSIAGEPGEDILFMATWGAAGSNWAFSAAAGDSSAREQLVGAFVAAAT